MVTSTLSIGAYCTRYPPKKETLGRLAPLKAEARRCMDQEKSRNHRSNRRSSLRTMTANFWSSAATLAALKSPSSITGLKTSTCSTRRPSSLLTCTGQMMWFSSTAPQSSFDPSSRLARRLIRSKSINISWKTAFRAAMRVLVGMSTRLRSHLPQLQSAMRPPHSASFSLIGGGVA